MPVIRPSAALRATRSLQQATTTTAIPPTTATATTAVVARRQQQQQFSSTARRSSSHGPEYDPPTGWLFGVKPGEKYQKEGWETIFYVGVLGSLGVTAVALAFKPDTSIQTWALEEARRRLEAEGILEDPFPEEKP